MKRTCCVNGTVIPYELTYKPVKNINLRVRSDGTVHISAPSFVTVEQIERLVAEKADLIKKAWEKVQTSPKPPPQKGPTVSAGAVIPILGEPKTVELVTEPLHESVEVNKDRLMFFVHDPSNVNHAWYLLESYRAKALDPLISDLCRHAYMKFSAKKKFACPSVRLRHMRTMWGNCYPTKNFVTFNTLLYHFPPALIEHVVYHEFTHFFVQNHSESFYRQLAEFVPDWEQRREQTKRIATEYRILEL